MTLPKQVPKLGKKWRKSSFSDKGTDCVEARDVGVVEVRDTKDRDGGQLAVTGAAWRALLANIARD